MRQGFAAQARVPAQFETGSGHLVIVVVLIDLKESRSLGQSGHEEHNNANGRELDRRSSARRN